MKLKKSENPNFNDTKFKADAGEKTTTWDIYVCCIN